MISQELLSEVIKEIFNADKVDSLQFSQIISVNQIVTFTIKEKTYLMKILIRPPTSENEFYRLEKEAKLMKQLHFQQSFGDSSKESRISIPVPEIFHIETNEERIGFKFIIMEYLQDPVLESIWNELRESDKEKLVKNLARILKEIHGIKFEMYGEIEEFDHPRKFYSFESMIKANIRRFSIILGKTKIIPIELVTKAQLFIEEVLNNWSFHTQPSLLHRDLNRENILVRKNEADEWIISAILDFEWSYSGNQLFDLFEITEMFEDTKLQRAFFFEYFEGEKQDLKEYEIERKIVALYHAIETTAIGWVHFHPTKENINNVVTKIKHILQN